MGFGYPYYGGYYGYPYYPYTYAPPYYDPYYSDPSYGDPNAYGPPPQQQQYGAPHTAIRNTVRRSNSSTPRLTVLRSSKTELPSSNTVLRPMHRRLRSTLRRSRTRLRRRLRSPAIPRPRLASGSASAQSAPSKSENIP